MEKKKRKIFGVIATSVADIEQREILSGIIENAQKHDIDIIVISNIYNPIENSTAIEKENCIYERIASPLFDAFIIIPESVGNPELQKKINDELSKRSRIPTIVLGTPLPEFRLPDFPVINTSDENDLIDITDHLVDVHGCKNIDILTGGSHISVSHRRVEGYRRSLESHGIPFDESRVHFGDYWFPSGRELAKKYISGELDYPEALICCNDYMAYGVLDEFMEQGISITDKMYVIGYEYVRERHAHTPLLATYQRNRKALGEAAVDILMGMNISLYTPAHGRIIPGETCGCHGDFSDIRSEMKDIQTKEMYEFYNLFGQLEPRLTECRNLTDFVARCWEHQFMIREPSRLYLCLYENWYENSQGSDNMVRYNLLTYEKPAIFHRDDFCDFITGTSAPYYICPLFFSDRELGYIVLRFDKADTFDHIFRNWLKSIANGLELLRIKNDIRYLSACQNLSEQYDSLTSMLNENGLRKAYQSVEGEELCMVALRICLFDTDFSVLQTDETIYAILDAAEAVKQFCGKNNICARVHQNTFLCLVKSSETEDFCSELLAAMLYRREAYMKKYGMDSFVCTAKKCSGRPFNDVMEECGQALEEKMTVISSRRRDRNYQTALSIRNEIYSDNNNDLDPEKVREGFGGSAGYLRIMYKRIFGISFHQDCIAARVAKAKYLLAAGENTLQEAAFKCGYSDSKYFMRQFSRETGMTAKAFRDKVRVLVKSAN